MCLNTVEMLAMFNQFNDSQITEYIVVGSADVLKGAVSKFGHRFYSSEGM